MDRRSAEHRKKMIAPVVIAVLFLVYLGFYAAFIVDAAGWSPFFLLGALPLIALGAGMVCILRTRIKEIRSGEEDDLDNY